MSRQPFQLQFSVSDLKSQIKYGQPKPQIHVYLNDSPIGSTEKGDGLTTDFSTCIDVEYKFAHTQRLRFIVKNTAGRLIKTTEQRMTFGQCETTLAQVIQTGLCGQPLQLQTIGSEVDFGGNLNVRAFRANAEQGKFTVNISVSSLPKGFMSKPKSFVKLTIPSENGRLLHQSEIQQAVDPSYAGFTITDGMLTRFNTTLLIECFEFVDDSKIKKEREAVRTFKKHGEATFKPSDYFEQGQGRLQLGAYPLTLSGITYTQATFQPYNAYIQCGLNLKFTLAIDLSPASAPMRASEENLYYDILQVICSELDPYNAGAAVETFAFGESGKFWPLKDWTGKICGLDDVFQAYSVEAEEHMAGSSAPDVGPLVETFLKNSQSTFQEQADIYNVLIVLSSGHMSNLENLKSQFENIGQHLPTSVIVVGVGNDFSEFRELQSSFGESSLRKIMTFMDTSQTSIPDIEEAQYLEEKQQEEFGVNEEGELMGTQSSELAAYRAQYDEFTARIFQNIPGQVEQFYHDRSIKPMGY